jgi:hypothetical protein
MSKSDPFDIKYPKINLQELTAPVKDTFGNYREGTYKWKRNIIRIIWSGVIVETPYSLKQFPSMQEAVEGIKSMNDMPL